MKLQENEPVLVKSHTSRRFTLADAMILIAATALGLTPTRTILNIWEPLPQVFSPGLSSAVERILIARHVSVPCAAAWMLAVLILRAIRPRPAWQVALRKPGFLGCVIGSIIALASAVLSIFPWLVLRGNSAEKLSAEELLLTLVFVPAMVAASVGAVWLCLLFTKQWERSADWVDRLGMIVGWYWIIAGPIGFLLFICLWFI